MPAPIALFAYSRLNALKLTVDALLRNRIADQTSVYVFSDGAKTVAQEERVGEVRNYLKSVSGFGSIKIIESPENKGLAKSITSGVTEILKEFNEVIVLEDDIVTSPGFLEYMNEALRVYNADSSVMHISGFMFPIDPSGLPDTFFYQANTCWGWATWRNSWRHYTDDTKWLITELRNKNLAGKQFNSMQGNEYQRQLDKNLKGTLKTWAVKWHAVMKLNNGTALHPKQTFVQNVGMDGSGENCKVEDLSTILKDDLSLDVSAAKFQSADLALSRLSVYFRKRFSLIQKIRQRIKNM